MLCASAIQAAFLWFSYFIQKLAEIQKLYRCQSFEENMQILWIIQCLFYG